MLPILIVPGAPTTGGTRRSRNTGRCPPEASLAQESIRAWAMTGPTIPFVATGMRLLNAVQSLSHQTKDWFGTIDEVVLYTGVAWPMYSNPSPSIRPAPTRRKSKRSSIPAAFGWVPGACVWTNLKALQSFQDPGVLKG